jgi:DNA-binding XRE family transcriptional regulator
MKLADVKPQRKRVKLAADRFENGPVELLINIRKMREGRGLSLRECAKPSGISCATLARIEWGATPDLASALRMAAFLDMPLEKIWGLKP